MRSVLLRISDETLVPDLKDHLERTGTFEVEELGGTMIAVTGVYALDDHSQRREIASRLRIWQEAHPDARVVVLP
jgi:hypothetical protein